MGFDSVRTGEARLLRKMEYRMPSAYDDERQPFRKRFPPGSPEDLRQREAERRSQKSDVDRFRETTDRARSLSDRVTALDRTLQQKLESLQRSRSTRSIYELGKALQEETEAQQQIDRSRTDLHAVVVRYQRSLDGVQGGDLRQFRMAVERREEILTEADHILREYEQKAGIENPSVEVASFAPVSFSSLSDVAERVQPPVERLYPYGHRSGQGQRGHNGHLILSFSTGWGRQQKTLPNVSGNQGAMRLGLPQSIMINNIRHQRPLGQEGTERGFGAAEREADQMDYHIRALEEMGIQVRQTPDGTRVRITYIPEGEYIVIEGEKIWGPIGTKPALRQAQEPRRPRSFAEWQEERDAKRKSDREQSANIESSLASAPPMQPETLLRPSKPDAAPAAPAPVPSLQPRPKPSPFASVTPPPRSSRPASKPRAKGRSGSSRSVDLPPMRRPAAPSRPAISPRTSSLRPARRPETTRREERITPPQPSPSPSDDIPTTDDLPKRVDELPVPPVEPKQTPPSPVAPQPHAPDQQSRSSESSAQPSTPSPVREGSDSAAQPEEEGSEFIRETVQREWLAYQAGIVGIEQRINALAQNGNTQDSLSRIAADLAEITRHEDLFESRVQNRDLPAEEKQLLQKYLADAKRLRVVLQKLQETDSSLLPPPESEEAPTEPPPEESAPVAPVEAAPSDGILTLTPKQLLPFDKMTAAVGESVILQQEKYKDVVKSNDLADPPYHYLAVKGRGDAAVLNRFEGKWVLQWSTERQANRWSEPETFARNMPSAVRESEENALLRDLLAALQHENTDQQKR